MEGEERRRRINVAILLPGLPGSVLDEKSELVQKLVRDSFSVFTPEYIGTYGSSGTFTFENGVDTVLSLVKAITSQQRRRTKKNNNSNHNENVDEDFFYDIWRGKRFTFPVDNRKSILLGDILLIGGSYGASVALVSAAKSPLVDKVVSISAKATFRHEQEENRELLRVIEEGYGNIYRTDTASRKRFERGSVDLNPIEYARDLSHKKKNILLIHGTKDEVVSYKESMKLYQSITRNAWKKGTSAGRCRIILLEGVGHSGGSLAGVDAVYKKIRFWLEENGAL